MKSGEEWRCICFSTFAGPPLEPRAMKRFASRGGGLVRAFEREGHVTPNQVTAVRVVAAFAAVGLFTFFGNALAADLAAVALTIAAIALDGVDGYLARTRGLATPLGAQLDIVGDRIVENLFFMFFAVSGLISFWVPVLFFVRGTLTDFLRSLAARSGRVGFGSNSMLETWWGQTLVASRASRAGYAILKCVCFCCLGLLLPVRQTPAGWFAASLQIWFSVTARALVVATVTFCVIRALPVIWDGRKYFNDVEKPVSPAVAQVIR